VDDRLERLVAIWNSLSVGQRAAIEDTDQGLYDQLEDLRDDVNREAVPR
jgi:hypothetical protein